MNKFLITVLLAVVFSLAAQAQDIAIGSITVNPGGNVTITGTSTANRVTVNGNGTSNITLNGVNITGGTGDDQAPITVKSGANVTITLSGNSSLTAQGINAGLRVEPGATVTITGSGKLTAQGGGSDNGGAGIGGMGLNDATRLSTGTITITGNAEVIANGGHRGAGIGCGGYMGNAKIYTGAITISGNANVTATGGWDAAGIGAGPDLVANNGSVTISGGTVTANGTQGGAGIGGGWGGGSSAGGGTITISGGVVTATSGAHDAYGIGEGGSSNTATINISGGVVYTNKINHEEGISGGFVVVGGVLKSGNITANITIPNGQTLTIPNGKTVTVANGATLTNNGRIEVDQGGKLVVVADGGVQNNGVIYYYNDDCIQNIGYIKGNTPVPSYIIDISNSSPKESGLGWTRSGNTYTITGAVRIFGTGAGRSVVVASGGVLTVQSGGTFTSKVHIRVQNGGTLNVPSGTTLANDGAVEIENGGTLNVQSGGTFTNTNSGRIIIQGGGRLTVAADGGLPNNGKIHYFHDADITNLANSYGNITINPPIKGGVSAGATIDMSDPAPPSGGTGWSYSNSKYTVTGEVTIIGDNGESNRCLQLNNGAKLIVDGNVKIKASGFTRTIYLSQSSAATISGNGVIELEGGWGFEPDQNSQLTIDGNVVFSTSGISYDELGGNTNLFTMTVTKGLFLNGNSGTVGGSFTLPSDITVASGKTLTIPAGATLTAPNGKTLTNSGAILVRDGGSLSVAANNGVQNSGTIAYYTGMMTNPSYVNGTAPVAVSAAIDMSAGLPESGFSIPDDFGTDWAYSNGVYTVKENKTVTITGDGTGSNRRVSISDGAVLNLSGSIKIAGNAAITVPASASATIGGTGTLEATSSINVGSGGTLTLNGDVAVIASGVSGDAPTVTKGLLISGNNGTVGGSVTLSSDITIASGKALTIPNGATLTVPNGKTLTNSGAIAIPSGGTLTLSSGGTLINNNVIFQLSGATFTGKENVSGNGVIDGTTVNMQNAEETAYSQYIMGVAISGITWSKQSGDLPPGLSLTGATGLVSGTATADGTYTSTMRATLAANTSIYMDMSVVIQVVATGANRDVIDMSDTTPLRYGAGWTYSGGTDGVYTITAGSTVTITGDGTGSNRRVTISDGATLNLSGSVKIAGSPAINVPASANATIGGAGTLEATTNNKGLNATQRSVVAI